MSKKPHAKPDPLAEALASLNHRISKLENPSIDKVADYVYVGADGVGKAITGPPNAMDNSINRLLEIIGRVKRASTATQELADAYDGSVPQSAAPSVPEGRAPLSSMISWLDREVDILLDQLGRIHPNPRS